MTVQNSVRSYIGIAKETTKGTPVAPTTFIPVSVSKLKPVDVIDPLYDEGLRGSLVKNYNYIQGRTRSTFDIGGPVFPDTIPFALGGVLGSVVTTGSSAPYTHTVSLKNASATGADAQPTSFTLTDFYAANVRAYPGVQFHDFSLKFTAEGLLDYDCKGTGWQSATASTPTPSFSTVLPVPTWQGTVSVGGTTVSNTVDGNIDMKRSVKPIYGLGNTQNPYQVFVGALEVTGKFKFVMESDTQLTNFISNSQPAIVLNWTNGSGASATQIQATISKGAYTAAVIDRGGDYVAIDIDLNAQANTTDAGATSGYAPIKWVIQNGITSGSYQ
jgi:Phage tail tube protein